MAGGCSDTPRFRPSCEKAHCSRLLGGECWSTHGRGYFTPQKLVLEWCGEVWQMMAMDRPVLTGVRAEEPERKTTLRIWVSVDDRLRRIAAENGMPLARVINRFLEFACDKHEAKEPQ